MASPGKKDYDTRIIVIFWHKPRKIVTAPPTHHLTSTGKTVTFQEIKLQNGFQLEKSLQDTRIGNPQQFFNSNS